MNYSKMTDGEISVLVGKLENPKDEVVPNRFNPKGATIIKRFGKVAHEFGFFPTHRSEDGFSIITRNRIALTPSGKTSWKASHESGFTASHRNPLRAAMIVYLMISEGRAGV